MHSKVFVVHGRNEKMRKSMFDFLRSIDIEPLEWSKIVKETGDLNPYIGDVLEKGFSISDAIVILMTPDDEAYLKEEFHKRDDPAYERELTGQPRQNVLIETGMALGKYPKQTIITQIGNLRQISDILGKHVIKLNNSPEHRNELANKLEMAGCKINLSGQDWYYAGNFDIDCSKDISGHEPKKPYVKKREKMYWGIQGKIQKLIDDDFFQTPKNLDDIENALKTNGDKYNKSIISETLKNMCDFKEKLMKMKNGQRYYYKIKENFST